MGADGEGNGREREGREGIEGVKREEREGLGKEDVERGDGRVGGSGSRKQEEGGGMEGGGGERGDASNGGNWDIGLGGAAGRKGGTDGRRSMAEG